MSARALHSILSTAPGWHEFHAHPEDHWMTVWANGQPRRFEACCKLADSRVAFVPRNSADPRDVGAWCGCLWVRLETKKHADALSRFRRGPSLVVREGRTPRRWALWQLVDPLPLDLVARGNRALAFTLGCVQKWGAEPEVSFLPTPGSMLSLGRRTPLAVHIEFEAERRYRPGDFRGVVKKPPERNTEEWMRRAA